jgi:hypothetical protein
MKPFTYYLYHKPTGLKYYGVRHTKTANPSELWTTYFSSSTKVKELISQFGTESFEFQIRKVFGTSKEALLWEHKFLTKINAANNKQWINRHNGGSKFRAPVSHTEKTKNKIKRKLTGITRSAKTKDRMAESAKNREEKKRKEGWKMPKSSIEQALATRAERIASGKINPYSKNRNSKMSKSKTGSKRHYLPDGSFIMIKPT